MQKNKIHSNIMIENLENTSAIDNNINSENDLKNNLYNNIMENLKNNLVYDNIDYEYYKKLSVSDKRKLTMKRNKELKELQKDPENNNERITLGPLEIQAEKVLFFRCKSDFFCEKLPFFRSMSEKKY